LSSIRSIVIVSPPAATVTGIPGSSTPVRLGVPEYTLAFLGRLCSGTLPSRPRVIMSFKKGAQALRRVRRRIAYGPFELALETIGAPLPAFEQSLRKSDLALVSATFTSEAWGAVQVIHGAKRICPEKPILVGGTDAASRPDFYLRNGADIVVVGSAEVTLPSLLQCLDSGRTWAAVPNLAWRSTAGRTVFTRVQRMPSGVQFLNDSESAARLMAEPLMVGDELHEGPPPAGVSPMSIYLRTSEGCRPGDCGFCTTPQKTGGPAGYQPMTLAALNALLQEVMRQNVHTLQVIDDNFLAREDMPGGEANIFEVLNMFRRLGFAWEFANGLQLSRLLRHGRPRRDLIGALFSPEPGVNGRLVGGYRAFVPFETALRQRPPGDYRRWSKMDGFGLDEAISLLEAFDKAGVCMLSLGVMIGFPDDTMRDVDETVGGMKVVERTIRFLNRQRRARGLSPMETHWDIMIYMLLPGTPDFHRHRHRVLFGDDYDTAPELVSFQTATYWPDNFTPWELTEIRAQIAREFNGVDAAIDEVRTTRHFYKALG